jgi:homoserine kinase
MGLPEQPVAVRVPATSANLGPGFDALGLALGLYDEVEVRATGTASGVDIQVTGEGAQDVADAGERHLIVRALRVALDDLDIPQPPGLTLRCVNRIPHGRGLGSSAAAIVAGLLAARALAGASLAPADVLPLASTLEGHPDNVAPCLFGGLTIAWTSAGAAGLPAARAVRLDPLPDVRPVAFIPPEPVSTNVARGLLPASVPHGDAARNAGRAALLIAALTDRTALTSPGALLDATEDWLHQDYRAPAMPLSRELRSRLRDAGIPAVVSGAGPTVLAFLLTGNPDMTGSRRISPELGPDNVRLLDSIAAETGIHWRISPLDVERQGASVTPGADAASGAGPSSPGC